MASFLFRNLTADATALIKDIKATNSEVSASIQTTSSLFLDTISSVGKNLTAATTELRGEISNISSLLSAASGSSACAAVATHSLMQSLDTDYQKIRTLMSDNGPQKSVLQHIGSGLKNHPLGILSSLTGMATAHNVGAFGTHFVSFCSMLGLEESLYAKVLDRLTINPQSMPTPFSHYTPGDFSPEAEVDLSYVVSMISLLTNMAGMTKFLPNSVKSLLDNGAKMMANAEGWRKIVVVLEDLLNEIGIYSQPRHKLIKKMQVQLGFALENCEEFDALLALSAVRVLAPGTRRRFDAYVKSVRELNLFVLSKEIRPQFSQAFVTSVVTLSRRADEQHLTVLKLSAGSIARPCPVGISLVGPSNLGKSTAVKHLLAKVSKHLVRLTRDDEDVDFSDAESWMTWNQNSTDSFDQNYAGQPYHVVDDAFQDASQKDHLTFIQKISTTPCSTYQADLSSKGMPYTSRVVLVTCNHFPQNTTTLSDITALWNRFPVSIRFSRRLDEHGAVVPLPDGIIQRNSTTYDSSYSWVKIELREKTAAGSRYVEGSLDQVAEDIARRIIASERLAQDSNAPPPSPEEPFVDAVEEVEELPATVEILGLGNPFEDFQPDEEEGFCLDTARAIGFPLQSILSHPLAHLLEQVSTGSHTLREYLELFPEMLEPALFYQYRCVLRNTVSGSGALEQFLGIPVLCLDPMIEAMVVAYWNGRELSWHPDPSANRWWKDLKPSTADLWHRLTGWSQFWNSTGSVRLFFGRISSVLLSPLYHAVSSLVGLLYGNHDLDYHIGLVFDCIAAVIGGTLMGLGIFLLLALLMEGVDKFLLWRKSVPARLMFKTPSEEWKNKLSQRDSVLEPWNNPPVDPYGEYIAYVKQVDIHNVLCIRMGFLWVCDQSHTFRKQPATKFLSAECCVTPWIGLFEAGSTASDSPTPPEKRRARQNLAGGGSKPFRNVRRENNVLDFSEVVDLDDVVASLVERTPPVPRVRLSVRASPAQIDVEPEEHGGVEIPDAVDLRIQRTKVVSKSLTLRARDLPAVPPPPQLFEEPTMPTIHQVAVDLGRYVRELEEDSLVEPELSLDPNAQSLVKAIKDKHLVPIISQDKRGTLYGLHTQKIVIAPYHIARSGVHVTVRVEGVEYAATVVSAIPSWDLCLIQLPPTAPTVVSLLKHVVSDERFFTAARRSTFIQYYPKSDLTALVAGTYAHTLEDVNKSVFHNRIVVTGLNVNLALSQPGDCGTPLIAFNPSVPQKIVGMHVAGCKAGLTSFSTALSVQRIQLLVSRIGMPFDTPMPALVGTVDQSWSPASLLNPNEEYFVAAHLEEGEHFGEGTFQYFGDLCFTSFPTDGRGILKPTPFASKGFPFPENMKFPAVLRESDKRLKDSSLLAKTQYGKPNILLTQLRKYAGTDGQLDQVLLDSVVSQLLDYSVSVMKDDVLGCSDRQVMLWEAINGSETDVHYQELAYKSSSGIPWNTIGGTRKIDFLTSVTTEGSVGNVAGYWFSDSPSARLLYHVTNHKLDEALEGRRTMSLWKDCLKDELRPLENIEIGKTRAFTSAPFETVLATRALFGRYKAAWTHHGVDLFHTVGIDPNSSAWGRLRSHLCARDANFIDGDFSNFDGTIPSQLMRAAGDLIIETIRFVDDDGHTLARETIWEEFITTLQVAYRTVYQKTHGNNSGNAMTTPINTWVGIISDVYVYFLTTGARSLSQWMTDVVFVGFGDDSIRSVAKDARQGYNPASITETYAQFGMKFTTAGKKSVTDWMSIEDITYLQRRFVEKSGSVVLAPLDKRSVYQCFNYCSIPSTDLVGWKSQTHEQLLEAARHGKEFYLRVSSCLRKACLTVADQALRNAVSIQLSLTFVDALAEVVNRLGSAQIVRL